MEPSPGTVDLASLTPPLRALVEGQQATVEALRAEVVSLTDRNRNLEDRNRRLEHLVRELRRAIYGKKSEKLHPDQLSNNLGLDETTVRVLDPGRGKTKTGYMWTMARDERGWSGPDPPGCVYEYVPSRSGKHGEKLLEGFEGTVQVDGYPGHNRLRREDRPGGALTLAACWVNVAARNMLRRVGFPLRSMRIHHASAI